MAWTVKVSKVVRERISPKTRRNRSFRRKRGRRTSWSFSAAYLSQPDTRTSTMMFLIQFITMVLFTMADLLLIRTSRLLILQFLLLDLYVSSQADTKLLPKVNP